MFIQKTIITFSVLALLTACGGSSDSGGSGELYKGSTSAAVVSEDNKADLVQASALAAKQVISSDTGALPFGAEADNNAEAANHVVEHLLQLNALPVGADVSAEICTDGGSASVDGTETQSDFTFNNCSFGGITFTGSGSATINPDGSSVIVYKDFTMTIGEESFTLNLTATCDAQDNCTYSSDFVAVNGETYRISDTAQSGSNTSGYNISATVFDSELGKVSFTSTGMLFDCDNGYPSSGSLTITDANDNDVAVTFNSCTQYSVTLDGSAETLDW